MTKKGPLGRAEVFYIQSFHSEKTAQELAKELDRAVSIVKKEIAKIEPVQEDKDKAREEYLELEHAVETGDIIYF